MVGYPHPADCRRSGTSIAAHDAATDTAGSDTNYTTGNVTNYTGGNATDYTADGFTNNTGSDTTTSSFEVNCFQTSSSNRFRSST